MIDPLLVAISEATRHGFDVRVTHSKLRGFTVSICPWRVIAGEATERMETDPVCVSRVNLTDALGNALAIVGVEIGIDRAAKERRLAE